MKKNYLQGTTGGICPTKVVDLSDIEYYESISSLVDGFWDLDCPYQFCGITCKDYHFVQIVRAFEEYPTVHLFLDKELARKFMALDVSAYFYCQDPVNFPYGFQSNLELYPHTIAAVLTIVVQELFGATEEDLIYDIEDEEVVVEGEDLIFVKSGATVYSDGAWCTSGPKAFGTNTVRTVLILLAILVGIVILALI